jgi:hypothetical protein
MDCIRQIRGEQSRLSGRPVSPAFHLTVLEQALRFIREQLPEAAERIELRAEALQELRAACAEAQAALADYRAGSAVNP